VQTKVVAFYDLDHTIIDTNSNKHWIVKEVKAGRVTPKLILTAIYWFARYAMGQGQGAEAAGAEAAMAYAGKSAKALQMEVEDVFDKHLAHRMRPGCGPSMKRHRENDVRVIICTSSWQYAARYAAQIFGLETDDNNIISSVMEEDANGVLTGGIAEIAYGDGKYHVTKKWADANGVDLKDCYFYSDSMSDVLLLEKVGHPVVVNPDPRLKKHAEQRGWPIEDWGKAEEAVPDKKPGLRWR
jgi:HAD superfamily hydrolase (TIGR01490 family)